MKYTEVKNEKRLFLRYANSYAASIVELLLHCDLGCKGAEWFDVLWIEIIGEAVWWAAVQIEKLCFIAFLFDTLWMNELGKKSLWSLLDPLPIQKH